MLISPFVISILFEDVSIPINILPVSVIFKLFNVPTFSKLLFLTVSPNVSSDNTIFSFI